MAKKKLPVYSIHHIRGEHPAPTELIAMNFSEYLARRDYLFNAHRHSFYHLVYFTAGAGTHTIDFHRFTVGPGQIYFMTPGQVHSWQFEGKTDGFIVNFSADLFQEIQDPVQYLEQFPFFNGIQQDQAIQLSGDAQQAVLPLFKKIVTESDQLKSQAIVMIRALLLQVFITVSREMPQRKSEQKNKPGYLMLRNFQQLLNIHFAQKKLPSEYASLLHITPNYLNSVCKELLGQPAGEVIRERILLEAKRQLVNADTHIAEIAYRLNFSDNSYFSKFFRKYTGSTPEEFRKEYGPA